MIEELVPSGGLDDTLDYDNLNKIWYGAVRLTYDKTTGKMTAEKYFSENPFDPEDTSIT